MISVLAVIAVATTIAAVVSGDLNSKGGDSESETVHIFLLMVPESKIEALRRRVPRQEEGVGAIGAIGEAVGPAGNVGQILAGVLGGDLRPIFAGSTAFIPEGDFREGVTEILQQTVAPAIQRILTEFNNNVQRHFNSTTTRPPNQQQQQQNNQNGADNNNFQVQNQQNFNPNGRPSLQQQQFQPNFNNQFQQNPNYGTLGGGASIGGGGVGVSNNFNPNNYHPTLQQQNQLYQPEQSYLNSNNQLQQPIYSNNPSNNYNQQLNSNNNFNNQLPLNQAHLQISRPQSGSSGNQYQINNASPIQAAPPRRRPASHPQLLQGDQFHPPAQSFPGPLNSNQLTNS